MNAEDMTKLASLGEWMAYGFFEAEMEALPWPIPYGRAFRRLYENMEIRIIKDRLIAPCEPLPIAQNMESHKRWWATSLICDFNHNQGLHVNKDIADLKKLERPELAPLIESLCSDLNDRFKHHGGYTHSNPDIRRVVDEGFLSMERELDTELNAVKKLGAETDASELNLLLALKEYASGVKAFHARTLLALKDAVLKSEGIRKSKLKRLASAFSNCFLWKSESFLEGLLAVNLTWMLDSCDSIGRFDQTLGTLFERDIKDGRLEIEFARELLDEVWKNFERFNGWNLQIGGRRSDGKDGCNMLTRECLLACERNKLRRPNVAFRITSDTQEALICDALRAIANGSGRPALYNDDLYIKSLLSMDLGLSEEDAREIGFGGCTETMIAGMSNVGSLDGSLNLAKSLELALNDGFDPVSKFQRGPHTGQFKSFMNFDDFLSAFKRQVQYMTDTFAAWNGTELRARFKEGDPKLYRTFFTRDCVKNRKSFEAGGARYNWSVVTYQGIANAIDGLVAIKHLVYEEKAISQENLLNALKNDFKGVEHLRIRLISAPKFGNDIPAADALAHDVTNFAWSELNSHSTPRGGRYLGSCILFTTYLEAGKGVGATPDGRHAFTALTDSVGAAAGRDKLGPTALLKSVCALPLTLAAGTPVLNIRLSGELFKSPAGLERMQKLLKAYFNKGGMQLQISVLDAKEMHDAQKCPANHESLIVRIGGFSEYFTRLGKELQDTVIERTEHGV